MFGVGTGEILLILLIAMLVVGPERMVQISRQLGQMVAKFRQTTDEATQEFREAFSLETEGSADEEAPSPAAEGATSESNTVAATEHGAQPEEAKATAPEGAGEPEVAPAVLEAIRIESNLAEELVDGEIEVQWPEGVSETGGIAQDAAVAQITQPADTSVADDGAPVLVEVATLVPEDEDVEPLVIEAVQVVEEQHTALPSAEDGE